MQHLEDNEVLVSMAMEQEITRGSYHPPDVDSLLVGYDVE